MNYDRSSWRYMNYESGFSKEDLDCYKIGGAIHQNYDIMEPYRIGKGGGSAYGGQWKPNPAKPADMAFVGEPNSRQRHYIPTKRVDIGLKKSIMRTVKPISFAMKLITEIIPVIQIHMTTKSSGWGRITIRNGEQLPITRMEMSRI